MCVVVLPTRSFCHACESKRLRSHPVKQEHEHFVVMGVQDEKKHLSNELQRFWERAEILNLTIGTPVVKPLSGMLKTFLL